MQLFRLGWPAARHCNGPAAVEAATANSCQQVYGAAATTAAKTERSSVRLLMTAVTPTSHRDIPLTPRLWCHYKVCWPWKLSTAQRLSFPYLGFLTKKNIYFRVPQICTNYILKHQLNGCCPILNGLQATWTVCECEKWKLATWAVEKYKFSSFLSRTRSTNHLERP